MAVVRRLCEVGAVERFDDCQYIGKGLVESAFNLLEGRVRVHTKRRSSERQNGHRGRPSAFSELAARLLRAALETWYEKTTNRENRKKI